MSIPIKKQMSLKYPNDGPNIMAVYILVDGSMYGVDLSGVLHVFNRSYMGYLLRNEFKARMTAYHNTRRRANLMEKQGDLLDADMMRTESEKFLKADIAVASAMLAAFKSFKPAKPVKADSRAVPPKRGRGRPRKNTV